ncbi:MAG: hypothetical protein S4CHLAM37_08490 [Chlamydiia bacterium]|nr:hypothetical protein [Chlamydiia bacterium]
MKKFWITLLCIFSVAAVSSGTYYGLKFYKNEPSPFVATPFDTYIELSWKEDPNAAYYTVCSSTKNFPTSINDGEKIYVGKGIKLINVQADRNLDNGTTYYYTLFAIDRTGSIVNSFDTSATPTPMQHKNLVENADFSNNLVYWSRSQGGNIEVKKAKDPSIGYYVEMSPSSISSAFLKQKISGLKPKTLYTVSLETFSNSISTPPTFSISGGIQQEQQLKNLTPPPKTQPVFGFGPLTYSYAELSDLNKWQRKSFVFFTGSNDSKSPNRFDGTVTLTLTAPRTQDPNAYSAYAQVQVIEGITPFYYPTPKVPEIGESLVQNPTFKGKPPKDWTLSNTTIINERINPKTTASVLKLNPNETETSDAVQISPFELALNSTYRFNCLVKVDPGKIAYIYLYDKYTNNPLFSMPISQHLADGNWHAVSKTFKTPSSLRVLPMLMFSAYKQQGEGWHASFTKPYLPAVGGEALPEAYPIPQMQLGEKIWSFDRGFLDPSEWLILNQKGSYPNNISFTTIPNNEGKLVKVMKLTGYGSKAETDRQYRGASIMTRDYFASGRYDVFAKIGDVYEEDGSLDPNFKNRGPLGCCFAIWPYSYITYADTHNPRLFDEPNPIRNTEIDIELPGALPKGARNFSFNQGRLNTWGGQRGGDGGNIELHRKVPKNISLLDGKIHQFTIVWHSGTDTEGDERVPGFVKWYVDTGATLNEDNLWAEWRGSSYGFDNIPYRCARLYMGCWFPPGSYNTSGTWVPGWAGTPSWYSADFYIEKVIYAPLSEKMLDGYPLPNRDRYEPETSPTHYWHQMSIPK